jgi:DNA-binding NarL/FixJ family response regulator
MIEKIRIIIAEDHSMYREGLKLMLEKEDTIEIAGETENGRELVKITDELNPDVIVTDIEMPVMNGIDATREIKLKFPELPVIALTMYGEDYLIVDMMEAGASGYLLKSNRKEKLIEAIRAVYEGKKYFCESTSMRLAKLLAKSKMKQKQNNASFSEKETEIMRLICEQLSSKQIAERTNLTHRTVEKYRENIMQKTNSLNLAGIVVYAIKEGIFKV